MDDGFGDGVLGQLESVIAWDASGRGVERPALLAQLDEDVAGHDPRAHHREAVLDQRFCDATPRSALKPLDRQPHHERGVGLHHLESAGLRCVPEGLQIPRVDGRLYPLSTAVAGGLGVWVRIHGFDVAGDGGAPTATS